MRIRTVAFTLMLAFTSVAHACINSVGTDHTGRTFDLNWYVGQTMTQNIVEQSTRKYWLSRAAKTVQAARAQPDFRNLTNLGVLLIYQGQYDLAARHFLFVEQRFPGHHETAANLGTALELSGYDEVALKWIRIGIRRNAHEHQGSEWLHARILQAKISLARDPAYLNSHSVVGIAFGPGLVPALPPDSDLPAGNDGLPLKPWDLDQALSYQLHERTQFVPPKDPIVANLLLDWATLNLAGGPIENADALYRAAIMYGAPRDALMRRRQDLIKQTLAKANSTKARAPGNTCAICMPHPGD